MLVYVSVLGGGQDAIFCERELPPDPGSDQPYKTTGQSATITYAQLLEVIRQHLRAAHPAS